MITNLAGVTPAKASWATLPMPGVQPLLVDENGKEIEGNNVSGNLCIKLPGPVLYEPPMVIMNVAAPIILHLSRIIFYR